MPELAEWNGNYVEKDQNKKPALTHKQKKMKLKWAKEKQTEENEVKMG